MENETTITEFIVVGFSKLPEMKAFLFALFLCLYFFTVLGNITIIVIISVDAALQTPMYFFLRNLSFLELCFTSVTIPNMLVNLISEEGRISFFGCAAQLYFTYTRPKSSYSLDTDKWLSLSYSVITPILNPIIYSLRSKEVKGALRKLGTKIFLTSKAEVF